MKKKEQGAERLSIGERLNKSLGFPAELITPASVSLNGRNEAVVCGCRRIADFSEDLIRLEMRDFDVIFEGEGLGCPAYGGGKIVITGLFKSLTYDKRR